MIAGKIPVTVLNNEKIISVGNFVAKHHYIDMARIEPEVPLCAGLKEEVMSTEDLTGCIRFQIEMI